MDEIDRLVWVPDDMPPGSEVANFCVLDYDVHDAVPFIICRPGEEPDDVAEHNEKSVKKGYYGILEGNGFIRGVAGG